MLDKRNSAFKTISICTIIVMLILTFSISVIAKTLEELTEEVDICQEQVNNIEQIKEKLHDLANSLRSYLFVNNDFIDGLGQKWIELDNQQNDIICKINALKNEIENYKTFSDEDLDLLARVIHAEAADNSLLDRQLVGNVVVNRVGSISFPDTIRDVVYDGNGKQYSCIKGEKFKSTPPQQCYEIAKALLEGERFCPENVVFQASFKQGSGVYKKVGVHYFCYQ